MKQEWLYTIQGKVLGPVSSAGIAKLVLEGKLEPDSTVQSSIDHLWKKISEIKEITEIYHRPEASPITDEETARQFQTFVEVNPDGRDSSPIFYNISWKNLLFLNLLTGNITALIWFYRQWTYIRNHRKENPNSKRITMWFFNYDIFRAIERHPEFMKIRRASFNPAYLAIIQVGIAVSPFTGFGVGWMNWFLYAAVYIGYAYTLVPVQKYINECNRALGRG